MKSNIKPDQIIKTGEDKWKVLSLTEDKSGSILLISVLSCSSHFSTYLNVGQEYMLHKHSSGYDAYPIVWEISADQMKRSSSQMLLFEWKNKCEMELDF